MEDQIVKCKYCLKYLATDEAWQKLTVDKLPTDEWNCDNCEVVCRIAIDMISSGVHSIGNPQEL